MLFTFFIASEITVNPFNEIVGPTIEVDDPLKQFDMFMTDEMVLMIVEETNRYAAACIERSGKEIEWLTSVEEIRSFLGFTILMGINRLPATSDYWSTDPVLHYFPVASRISRTRFQQIKKYLHFTDNRYITAFGEEGYNRLAKVQPVIDMVKRVFLLNFQPHCQNSIDEAMIKFKGRVSNPKYLL